MGSKTRFGKVAEVKSSILSAAVAVVLLIGCGGGGKAGAGDYKLKVSVNPANGGSIKIDPNMESYNEWADVEITASENKGYVFEGWSGESTDKSNSVTIKMSGSRNKRLTANFKAPTIGTFKDSRDGKTYKSVKVGGQTWMGENLNYATEGSKCYGEGGEVVVNYDNYSTTRLSNAEVQANCEKYGRLYNWETALKACPAGYHLPSDDEWGALRVAVGGRDAAAEKLRSMDGWVDGDNGTDNYGWSALPSGSSSGYDGKFSGAGRSALWWSAEEYSAFDAYSDHISKYCGIYCKDDNARKKLYSVRCVQDN
jgi:uncharacterized protein (TIGR02145 family)/uncharacterized repeat protein (TIGR02543 family)